MIIATSGPPPPDGGTPPSSETGKCTNRISATELLGSAGQLVIVHNGEEYRLRITSNGKLLLTK